MNTDQTTTNANGPATVNRPARPGCELKAGHGWDTGIEALDDSHGLLIGDVPGGHCGVSRDHREQRLRRPVDLLAGHDRGRQPTERHRARCRPGAGARGHLRSYFTFAMENELIDVDPMARMRGRAPRGAPRGP